MTVTTSRVILHIGAMKTGTSYLQRALMSNREQLAEAGYAFPGAAWGDQVRAVEDVLRQTGRDAAAKLRAKGAWEHLTQEIAAADAATSIVSMEGFGFASRHQAARVLRGLDAAEVHIVLGVRDATATIPALWQTNISTGATQSWPDFMVAVRKALALTSWRSRHSFDAALRSFARAQDIDHMLHVWRGFLPPEQLHVFTVPPSGAEPSLLWERFCRSIGLDGSAFSRLPEPANESLGLASTELLRRVNVALGSVPRLDYDTTVKRPLALRIMARRRESETRARLNRATCEFALWWNKRSRIAVEASGAAVEGDLDDLPVSVSERLAPLLDEQQVGPTAEELLAAASDAVAGLDTVVTQRVRRLRRRGLDIPSEAVRKPRASATTSHPADAPVEEGVEAAVADIVKSVLLAIELERRLRGVSAKQRALSGGKDSGLAATAMVRATPRRARPT
jgi:hypothetical protein